MAMGAGTLTHLECSACGLRHEAGSLQSLCTACKRPLLARYDIRRAALTLQPGAMAERRSDLWRYGEMLPALGAPVALGEGWTPLLSTPALGRELGITDLRVKDEALNPTGSFKARGLALAVTMARERGVQQVVIPTAGNAGVATAGIGGGGRAGAEVTSGGRGGERKRRWGKAGVVTELPCPAGLPWDQLRQRV